MSHLLDLDAQLGSEEDDEDFNEETGEAGPKKKSANGTRFDDSSEEDDEDEDEEEAEKIRHGFIVDEDEDEDGDGETKERRRREKKKRKREQREEEEVLDEEDFDLIGESHPDARPSTAPKFKRLRAGHRDDRAARAPRGVDDIFSDDNDDALLDDSRYQREPDEFDDFIEEDEFPDEERDKMLEEREVARPGRKIYAGADGMQQSGLDEASIEDYRAAFGDGTEYDWALQKQDEADQPVRDTELQLKDVFEPSQLKDKMLTDEDNEIKMRDVPERFQLARKPFRQVELSEDDAAERAKEEAQWVTNMLLPKKRLDNYLVDPFQKAVAKVLEFFNKDDFEVPFIFQHRKDFLIHASRVQASPDPNNPDAPEEIVKADRLLTQSDMWEIFEQDMKFKALVEKRDTLERTYSNLQKLSTIDDEVFTTMLPQALTIEEVQDVQDYLHFQHSAALSDVNAMNAETNGTQKRARAGKTMWEKLRAGRVYNMVRAFGISADSFAQNALAGRRQMYTEDPSERPDDMADSLLDPPEFPTGAQVLRSAKAMYAEELTMSPRLRKFMRKTFYQTGAFDCFRTEKGARVITDDHRYYEFKYLRNQDFNTLLRRPELFLRMLKAEEEGLIEVKIRLLNYKNIKEKLYTYIESDNFSEVADAWNATRREVLDMALAKLEKIISKGVKETLKAECENELARNCRQKYSDKLDQAPYKPKGMVLGTPPRVLALSHGQGVFNRDAVCWAFVEHDGRLAENGKFTDIRLGNPDKYLPDGKDVEALVDLVKRRKPDVIGMSGFSVETKKLYKDLQDIVEKYDLQLEEQEDEDGNRLEDPKVDVILVNDETARLYHTSDRSALEYPAIATLTRYCVGLGRYLQNPMLEYAALGKDIISIAFDVNQDLLPQEKLLKHLDTAMVDMVNLVGVDILDAIADSRIANLLPYVCGLGPRKAAQVLKVININGGSVNTRAELAGVELADNPGKPTLAAVGPKVWENCASFLYIPYEETEPDSNYLDNTRVHPEDYAIASKMSADALELDEEDVQAETEENGDGGVVRKLIKEKQQDKVNDLILEEYAEQLENNFNQKKRATLETIRAEMQTPYEELRRNFALLSGDEIFTMLTGETRDSLAEGMIVPVTVRRAFGDHIEVKLDCGIEAGVSEAEYPEGVGGERGIDPRQAYAARQTLQAKILYLNRKGLTAQLSLREDALRRPFRREIDHQPDEWDDEQEAADKKAADKEKEQVSGRAQRVINHPLFKPFNTAQAEEYLGSQGRGDVVIRPSSKGLDHLAVTWKVSDNIYQHVDVLELDKESEFSLGRTLKIGGKYTYSDLDELIVNHIKAMAKKVDEMTGDERYQNGSRAQTEQWLTTYTEANPRRSMYAFCINPKFPGYFFLCFKAGLQAPLCHWPVKVIPNAFELLRNPYPDVRSLKNGFKVLFANGEMMNPVRAGPPGGRR